MWIEEKRCPTCGETKPVTDFSAHNGRKDGLQSQCKICGRAQVRKYSYKMRRESASFRIRHWATATRSDHKRNGYKINISIEEIINFLNHGHPKCNICGKLINTDFKNGKSCHDSPSLDRINNEKELNINNVQLLCRKCNTMKQDISMSDYISFCGMVWAKFKDDPGYKEDLHVHNE